MSDRPDIDGTFERALAALLQRSLEPGGPACPDPGTLAAYLTDRLATTEGEAIELHVSSCDPCQQQLAALTQIEPVNLPAAPPEPLLLTAEVEDEITPAPDSPAEASDEAPAAEEPHAVEAEPLLSESVTFPRKRRRIRWIAAPLALAATAVLGVLLTHRLAPDIAEVARRASGIAPMSSDSAMKRSRGTEVSGALEKKAAPEAPPPPAAALSVPTELPLAKPVEETPAALPQAASGGGLAAPKRQEESARPATDIGSPGAAGDKDQPAAQPAAPASEAGKFGAEEGSPAQRAAPAPNAAVLDAVPRAAEPRAKTAELAAPVSGGSQAKAAAASPPAKERQTSGTQISVPANESVVWRLMKATIERSDDGGASWRTQLVGSSRLAAGAAVTPNVCWVVGAGGTILRTTDGEHWSRITPPTAVDIVHVSATSAASATVQLANGKHLTTTDGGRTWSKQ